MSARPHARSGFTLIELLGVIAVLAILAAIAFPAIDNAIAKSRTATSTQNLKQFGIALKSFVADKGHYPAQFLTYEDGGNQVRQRWYHALSPYLNADARALTDAGNTDGSGGEAQGDRDQSVFNSAFRDPAVSDWSIGPHNSYGYNFQYLGNARRRQQVGVASPVYQGQQVFGFVNYPVRASQIQRPDRTIAIAGSDGTGAHYPYRSQLTAFSRSPNDNGNGPIAITPLPQGDASATVGNQGAYIDPTFVPIRDINNNGVNDYSGDAGNVDDIPGSADGNRRHYQGSRGIITNRHNGGTPVLFADGHVEFLLREDAYFDRSLGVFSNRLWNGFGVGNDRNGNGQLDPGETLIDPNEAWFQPGQTAIAPGVAATLALIGLDPQHRSTGSAGVAFYGPGFPGEQDPNLRGSLHGPTLPKAGPFPKLETNNVEALGN